jgi:hypothetical protein
VLDVDARYLIVGPTRSGTTALHTLLGGHPGISIYTGELYFPRLAAGVAGFCKGGHATESEERLGRLALFDALAGATREPAAQVLGAKTTANARGTALSILKAAREHLPGVKFIVPVRHDIVAHYGSRFKLQTTGVAHSWDKPDRSAQNAQIRIDRWLLGRSALWLFETYDALRKAAEFTDYHEIDYEAFAQDNDAVYRDMLKFLDLDYVAP